MKSFKKILLFGAFFALVACSSSSDFLFPDAEETKAEPVKQEARYDSASFISQKVLGFEKEVSEFKTYVDGRRQKASDYTNTANNSLSEYRMTVSQINSRLQAGTTPNNPELLDMWKDARTKLEKISDNAFELKRYAQDIDSDISMVDYFTDSIRASYRVGGATDAQHARLRNLEAQVKDIGTSINMMEKSADADAERQLAFVESEKQNLNDLALNIRNGKIYTASAAGMQSFADFNTFSTAKAATSTSLSSRGRPIFTINYDRDVNYQEPLFQALNRSLERNPQARFDLVVVTPKRFAGKASATAERNASEVLKTLTEMGLPTSRVALSTAIADVSTEEIQIFAK